MRADNDKDKLVDELRKTFIVSNACNKTGVPRSTYYRWLKEDPDFKERAERAQTEGKSFMNDAAESVIAAGIRNKDFRSAKYFLEHNHPAYMEKRLVVERYKEEQSARGNTEAHILLYGIETLELFREKYGMTLTEWLAMMERQRKDKPPTT